jgi:hypothetical protein
MVEGFAELRREMDARFDQIDARFDAIDTRFESIDARFREQEENFRRQCDVVVARIEALVRPVIEAHEHLATVVKNPELRLRAIENR